MSLAMLFCKSNRVILVLFHSVIQLLIEHSFYLQKVTHGTDMIGTDSFSGILHPFTCLKKIKKINKAVDLEGFQTGIKRKIQNEAQTCFTFMKNLQWRSTTSVAKHRATFFHGIVSTLKFMSYLTVTVKTFQMLKTNLMNLMGKAEQTLTQLMSTYLGRPELGSWTRQKPYMTLPLFSSSTSSSNPPSRGL